MSYIKLIIFNIIYSYDSQFDLNMFIPKAKYMTLGPTFFCCSKMAVTRRREHLNQYFLAGSPPLDVSYLSSLSKRDLKPSRTCFSKICMRPWIRRYLFSWIFAPGGRLRYEAYKNIYIYINKNRFEMFC